MREVLDDAQRDRDEAGRHPDPLSEETGGEFAFGTARADACAAAAWLDLGRGPEASVAAQSALAGLAAMPASRVSVSQLNGARIDLATACVLNRDLDCAEEALRPVLAPTSDVRNVSLSGRLARTRAALLSPSWASDTRARHIAGEIGAWLAGGPLPRALEPGRS